MKIAKPEKYKKYKSGEIDWLGEFPAHWEVKRIKDLSVLQSGDNVVSEQIEETGLYPVYGGGGFRGYFSDYTNDGNHILIGRQGALCGNINYASGKFWASEHAVVVYEKRRTKTKWYGEMLRVMNLNQYSVSAAQPGLAVDRIKRLLLPVPPIEEQQAIADYLDSKTAQIDRQIELLEQKAEKYADLKQSLINETVTRGLDKKVPMKDSGVEWIGQIPAHWEVKRVKEIGSIVLGKMLDNVSGEGKFYRSYLKSKNIGWLKVEDTSIEQMYFSQNEMKMYRLRKNDILLSEGGEVGKTSFWNNEIEECYIQNSVQKITVYKNNHPRYFLYQSFLLGSIKYYDSIVNQVSIKHLTKEKLSRVVMVRPPLEEQKAIADYLEAKTAHIEKIIETIRLEIEKLKELRKTLINDVVTGKIKVADRP